MAKTRISMDETKAICRYFNYLKRKYKINNSQLYNHCPDGPNQGGLTYKTIQAYLPEDQTGSRNPKHAFSNNTLNCLIESFSNILAVQGIAIPPELSTNFLLSSRLHSFIETLENDYAAPIINAPCNAVELHESQATTIDTKTAEKKLEPEHHLITCDPAQNNRFTTLLFSIGGLIVFGIFIFNLFVPQIQLKKMLFFGLICLSASIILALPKLKQPIDVDPQAKLFYLHYRIWSGILQFLVFLLMLMAKPLLCISIFGLFVCLFVL
jgi:hypothetical protein